MTDSITAALDARDRFFAQFPALVDFYDAEFEREVE